MTSFNETAQEQIRAAQGMARDALSHGQRMAAIFHSHLLKAQMEMVDGVREVLAHEIERADRAVASQAPAADASADEPQR
ncbi:hypothetical protein [Endothiovibrio diazotrophicus]